MKMGVSLVDLCLDATLSGTPLALGLDPSDGRIALYTSNIGAQSSSEFL